MVNISSSQAQQLPPSRPLVELPPTSSQTETATATSPLSQQQLSAAATHVSAKIAANINTATNASTKSTASSFAAMFLGTPSTPKTGEKNFAALNRGHNDDDPLDNYPKISAIEGSQEHAFS